MYSKDIFGTEDLDFKLEGNNIDITYLNKTNIFALRFKLVQNFVLFSLSLK